MNGGTGKPGQALASAGGLGLAASLWLPWYSIEIPQSALNSVVQMSQQLGALGSLMRSGAALISQLGPFHVTAWQAFNATPAVLLGAAIIGGGLALLALSDRAGSTSQLTMLAGVVGALLVGYRIAVPPGQGGFVHPAWGIYLALLGALAMLAGGFIASRAAGVPGAVAMSPHPAPYPPATYPPAPYPPAPAATGWGVVEAAGWGVAEATGLGVGEATGPGMSVPPPAA
jgi:hypothetical protein